MASHRIERISEAIREVVASAILTELADPRIQGVTVLRADVSGDLRHASVYVTLMGSEGQQKLALKGLQSAAGYLQSRVAARLQTRYTPALAFKVDEGVKKSIAMSKLIEEALAADRAAHPGDAAADPDTAHAPPAADADDDA